MLRHLPALPLLMGVGLALAPLSAIAAPGSAAPAAAGIPATRAARLLARGAQHRALQLLSQPPEATAHCCQLRRGHG